MPALIVRIGHPDQMATLIDGNGSFCVVMEEGKARALSIQKIRWHRAFICPPAD